MNKNYQELISIIIPCHNVLKHINEALESCFAQTHKNIEIILVENGSTDDSWNYCQMLAKKYQGVVFSYQSDYSLFAGGARNLGIEKARGDYLTFLDDDDTLYPDALKTLLNYSLRHGLEATVGTRTKIYPDGKIILQRPDISAILINDVRIDIPLTATSVLYKTSVIKQFDIRFDTTRLSEDTMFFTFSRLLLSKIGILSHLEKPVYCYKLRADSSTMMVDQFYISIVDVTMNIINEFEKRINIAEQRKQILADFYNTSLESNMLTKAASYAVRNFNSNMVHYMHILSDKRKKDFDKYVSNNNIFSKIANFEKKYGAKETVKLYYHQRLKKHGIVRKIILKSIRMFIKLLNYSEKMISIL